MYIFIYLFYLSIYLFVYLFIYLFCFLVCAEIPLKIQGLALNLINFDFFSTVIFEKNRLKFNVSFFFRKNLVEKIKTH